MILTIGLLICFLVGFSMLTVLNRSFSFAERIGLSFPLGLGLQTILMLLMDLVYIPLNSSTLLISSFVLLLGLNLFFVKNPKRLIPQFEKPDFKAINFVWILFIGLIAYYQWMNFSKCMYVPPIDRDSLTAFDTIGYLVGMEGTYHGISAFNPAYMPFLEQSGGVVAYTPFVQLAYGFVYALGAETSKIIPALMYLSFLFAMYGALRRLVSPTGAALGTLLMLLTPEMIAFSSLSMTNVMHAVFASLGIFYTTIWLKEKQCKDAFLAAILLGLNIWCRTEGIVFIGAALLVVWIDAIRNKQFKLPIWITVLSLLPILFFSLYRMIFGLNGGTMAITHLFWDGDKASIIWKYMSELFQNPVYYGVAIPVFVVFIVVNLWNIIKKGDQVYLLLMIFSAMIAYMVLLYQIDYKWDKIENVLMYSAKRFMFCFIPMIWYYVSTNRIMVYVWKKVDDFLRLK